MLVNLDKDCTTKQLITSLRNFYPISNEYYLFEFNDDDDFEVMVTITSIIQNNHTTSKTSSPVTNKTIINNDEKTAPLILTTFVDKTFVDKNNDVFVTRDLPPAPDIVQDFEKFDTHSDNDTTPPINPVNDSPILTIIDDDDNDDNSLSPPEFQDFDFLPVQQLTKASWSTAPTRGRMSKTSATTHSPSGSSFKTNIYDTFREDETNESSTNPNNSRTPIIHASTKVNLDVAKIVANSSPPPSNDTINEFPSSPEARHDDTPKQSNTVVTVDDCDSIAHHLAKSEHVILHDDDDNDSDSSVGMPRLQMRHDNTSSIDSDESHHFQDDKAIIAE